MLIRIAVCCSLVFGMVSVASAQSERKFGFVIGYPTVAGVQWQINDRFAIRGDAGFDWGTVETESPQLAFSSFGATPTLSTSTTSFHHSTASVGVSGLITVARRDQLRLYLAPRVAWNRQHSSISTVGATIAFPSGSVLGSVTTMLADRASSTTTNGIGVDGMFGANYRLGDRFEVFGEAGVSFMSPTASTSSSNSSITSYNIGSRSDVGIVIRF
jgi:hypothetical protein